MDAAALLAGAAFLAGALNTVAGGGTFLTFPALVSVGIPPVAANATSSVAVFPGYLGGALGFRRELRAFDRRLLLRATALTVIGGLAASLLLLVSSDAAFSAVVPFLLAGATAIFAFSNRIQRWARRRSRMVAPGCASSTLAVAIYGGYFNGGLGIVLLALFALWGLREIHAMNGLKSVLSFVLSAVSVLTFSSAGLVAWPEALIMMAAAVAGGYLGAPLARALPERAVRGVVIGVGATMSAIFFYRLVDGG
ncbi:MAG: sulfite exporter TauE/SafE family protein [Rhodospirillales bacterium]|nr:sulfite exporter TauE/SafE family protein [Rhodospirillales bacterium]